MAGRSSDLGEDVVKTRFDFHFSFDAKTIKRIYYKTKHSYLIWLDFENSHIKRPDFYLPDVNKIVTFSVFLGEITNYLYTV